MTSYDRDYTDYDVDHDDTELCAGPGCDSTELESALVKCTTCGQKYCDLCTVTVGEEQFCALCAMKEQPLPA